MSERKETCCNFCGKPESLVDSMLSAGDVHICNECVCYCYEMLYGPTPQSRAKSGKKSKSSVKQIQLKKPADMKKILDEYPYETYCWVELTNMSLDRMLPRFR